MKKVFLFILLNVLFIQAFSQSNTILPDRVLPQLTTAQRNALTNPNGMLVFDTNTQTYWYRQSGAWTEIPQAGSTNNFWQQTGAGGNEIKNINSGGFWSANPTALTNASTDISNPPTAPANGEGTRMMWISSRSAFRVGSVFNNAWDGTNIGLFSFASGFNSKASGYGSTAMGIFTRAIGTISTAMGDGTTASGNYSTAMGDGTTASGNYSTAMGSNTTASEYNSTAMGFQTDASGQYSTSMGYQTNASGLQSTSMGSVTTASGAVSVAMGYNTTASGLNSTAIGRSNIASGEYSTSMGQGVSTNFQKGSFIIGDADPYSQGASSNFNSNQMFMRFANGYALLTSGDSPRTGMFANAGANSWSSISDSTKKEKTLPISGEDLLQKIARFKLSTWNYKGQDPAKFRHYGPMAQDFYAAFGHDAYGTIGCDTLINQADFDGINFAAIQALEKRTAELKAKTEELNMVLKRLEAIERKLIALETVNGSK
jgi:Head domain of trimeric autotransporter adhesin/Chaperone of endosialidase